MIIVPKKIPRKNGITMASLILLIVSFVASSYIASACLVTHSEVLNSGEKY